jgi:Ca2+-binding EF-hand superfamily protein
MKLLTKLSIATCCIALQAITSHAAPRQVSPDGLYAAVKQSRDDGKLTREELQQYPKLAAIMAKELGKGYVTEAEVTKTYKRHYKTTLDAFKEMDTDRDGKITLSEAARASRTLAQAFVYLDQGTKGYLVSSDFFSSKFLLQFASPKGKSSVAANDIDERANGSMLAQEAIKAGGAISPE